MYSSYPPIFIVYINFRSKIITSGLQCVNKSLELFNKPQYQLCTISWLFLIWNMAFTYIIVLFGIMLSNMKPADLVFEDKTYMASIQHQMDVYSAYLKYHLFTKSLVKRAPIGSNYQPKHFLACLMLTLLANSNDIQLNPGPQHNNSTIYPCGTCDQPVTWDHRAIVCDSCDQWYHIDCQDVHSGTYSNLSEDSGIRWDCIICDNPNYTTICFDLHSFQSTNHFSLLSDTSLTSPTLVITLNQFMHQHMRNPNHAMRKSEYCWKCWMSTANMRRTISTWLRTWLTVLNRI